MVPCRLAGKEVVAIMMSDVVNGRDWVAVLEWENGLRPGDPVLACWTNSFRYYQVPAEVVRNNAASVRIRLTTDHDGYRAGQQFAIPKLASPSGMFNEKWSPNNRVLPVEGLGR